MIIQSVKMAWESITSNKLRSFLTMLGIIIGVLSLVVMVSLVNGATGAVTDQINSLGNDMLSVAVLDDKGVPLRLEDLQTIQADDAVLQVAPSVSAQMTAKHGYKDAFVSVYGTTSAYYDINGLELECGRFIKTVDVENASYVAVISKEAEEELFGSDSALGETLNISGRAFKIVGVLKENDSMISMMVSGLAVYVPYTVESRMAGQPYVSSFCVSARNATDEAEKAVKDYLLARFAKDDNAFAIINISSVSDAMSTVTDTLSLLLGGVAAISLLVGGIGIMNIMLVSVTERTKEIGIRKAIGAGRKSILMQFLIEALMLSLLGCTIGLVFSWLILEIVSVIAGSITFKMSFGTVALAVIFSSAIGLLFGLYPANKAAKKHPIEALRYGG